MGHQYSNKFHQKNLPCVKVGRRVFKSLYNAESYCSDHGMDVNHNIEYAETEDFKNKVQEIAKSQKAILKEVKERLEQRSSELKKEIDLCVRNRETAHYLETGYWKDRLTEAIAKHSECGESMIQISKINEELERLTGWHD